MFEVVPLENQKKWDEIISSMAYSDFYHFNGYHTLNTEGVPFLFYYKDVSISIAFPLVMRRIWDLDYYDVTSVYGYPGPLSSMLNPPVDSIRHFQDELRCFFDSKRVISAFSRLHPLFVEQKVLLDGLKNVEYTGQTLGIDLSLKESFQRSDYSHSLYYDIEQLKRKGIEIIKGETEADMLCFASLYRETMERVNANSNYFFSDDYFRQFFKKINPILFFALHEGVIIAGTLCVECNGILQIHLSATKNEYVTWSPTKYIWDHIRREGCREKYKFLHLGGGVGGQRDSVFYFKNLFSKKRLNFMTWKYIHNHAVYEDLVRNSSLEKKETSIFPSYRV